MNAIIAFFISYLQLLTKIRLANISFLFLIVSFSLTAQQLDEKTQLEPKLQLASVYSATLNHRQIEISNYWISEKLDGVRAFWDGRQLFTRSGNVINSPKSFTQGWPKIALDGELWIARNTFEQVSGCIRKKQPTSCWQAIRFYIFDLPNHKGDFSQRIKQMKALVNRAQFSTQSPQNSRLLMVEQFRLSSNEQLQQKLAQVVANGGEGLMLHQQNAYYHHGRTANLLKLKKHQDAEAVVIAHHAGKGKYTGKLGAIEVETAEGLRFKIGSGFSDEERENPPKIGEIITYKYIGKTQRGVPRFASFLRVRPSI